MSGTEDTLAARGYIAVHGWLTWLTAVWYLQVWGQILRTWLGVHKHWIRHVKLAGRASRALGVHAAQHVHLTAHVTVVTRHAALHAHPPELRMLHQEHFPRAALRFERLRDAVFLWFWERKHKQSTQLVVFELRDLENWFYDHDVMEKCSFIKFKMNKCSLGKIQKINLVLKNSQKINVLCCLAVSSLVPWRAISQFKAFNILKVR